MAEKLPTYYSNIKWDLQLGNFFLVRFISSEEGFKTINIPDQWKITTGERRFCTGYISEKEGMKSCPFSLTLESKPSSNSTCDECSSKHAFACRAYCNGKICNPSSTKVKEICDANITQVYLTLIGDNLKVGVSTDPIRRWLDQGSDYSVILWKGDGLIARRIENKIGKFSEIGMRITVSEKIKALKSIKTPEIAEEMLETKRNELISKIELPTTEEYSKEFFNLLKYQGKITNRGLINVTPIFQPINENTLITGNLIVNKGSLMVLQDAGSYYVYNLKQLLGWELSRSHTKIKRKKKQSLMGYLGT